MKLKGWPILALTLLSGSHAGAGAASSAEPWVHLRDPEIFQAEVLPGLLGELSLDPDVRIAVANAGLRILADVRISRDLSVSTFTRQPNGLAALVAREGFIAGLDPRYLVRLANRESHFDPFAESPTSTAAGLFQFTDNTWLCSMREFGPGLGVVGSDQISQNRRGVCETLAPGERSRLLSLRSDPLVSSRIAAAFSLRNYRVLVSALGRAPTVSELYTLHFFGEIDGLRFLRAMAESPDAMAYPFSPAGAKANSRLFFGKHGQPKKVFEVFESLNLP
ncbi:hypothetical protein ABAC460_17325 [Asticcacaulis sp. AC460]|uniref:transglycosylase SLT domain-containing protein n=1 Tax=Asticcacaulis sp. AC460 TaxID=1282360 RepID=UPI0003C40D2E|nr:transglycosylase SLT domain-containing protein [Asticcacaulis sp. AC460]ESQ87953.1 hypothetical protein ABAC460_17325 [Asticcacaulis sp. AC460]